MQPDDQAVPAISDNEEQPQEAISDSKDFISEAQDVPVESNVQEKSEISDSEISDKKEKPKEAVSEEKAVPHISDKKDLIVEEEEATPSQVVTEQPVLQDKQPTPAPTPKKQDKPTISDKEDLISEKVEKHKSHSTENQVERDKLTPEQRVMQLTEEELDAARKLWARKHIATAQKKSNESRHARMVERMNEIEKLVKAEPNTTVHELANKMNLSEKLTSGYLQKLVKAGRIKASGNTNSRRYS